MRISISGCKHQLRFTLFSLCTCISSSCLAESNTRTLKAAYSELYDSLFGGEVQFQCGISTFKLTKTLTGKMSLELKEELNWEPLELLETSSIGFTVNGIGLRGKINDIWMSKQLSDATNDELIDDLKAIDSLLTIKQPELDCARNSVLQPSNPPLSYIAIKEGSEMVPYRAQLDVYSGFMKLDNILPIQHELVFDEDRFRRDFSTIYVRDFTSFTAFRDDSYEKMCIEYNRDEFLSRLKRLEQRREEYASLGLKVPSNEFLIDKLNKYDVSFKENKDLVSVKLFAFYYLVSSENMERADILTPAGQNEISQSCFLSQ